MEELESGSYSRDEVLALISKFQATTRDYLIRTYLHIFEITQGHLLYEFERRFSNIIFNNSKKIAESLIAEVFYKKAEDILEEELSSTTYISCIYPNRPNTVCPVLVQFFNPNHGIEHRLLRFITDSFNFNTVLTDHLILHKVVAYCGDFSYNDPGIANCKTDHFTSLCLLSGKKIRYLPHSDGFISRLFNLLIDYFPGNVSTSLMSLGETLAGMSRKTSLVQDLVRKYQQWTKSRTVHLLASDYVEYVIEHFNVINSYLESFRCLPQSIENLFGKVLQRFLLVFVKEIYMKVTEIKLADNCAVMYYYQLFQVRDMFKLFEQSHYLPPRALLYFNKEIEELIENHVLDRITDEGKINGLFKEVMSITNECYVRAVHYIEPLLEHFENFDVFLWILLKDLTVDEEQVHQTYHVITGENCSQCPRLLKEVEELNLFLKKCSFVEMEDNVVSKWLVILKTLNSLTMIPKLLEYLFALPASYDLTRVTVNSDYDGDECFSEIIKFNWRRFCHEDVINNLEQFLNGYEDLVEKIIKDNQITAFID